MENNRRHAAFSFRIRNALCRQLLGRSIPYSLPMRGSCMEWETTILDKLVLRKGRAIHLNTSCDRFPFLYGKTAVPVQSFLLPAERAILSSSQTLERCIRLGKGSTDNSALVELQSISVPRHWFLACLSIASFRQPVAALILLFLQPAEMFSHLGKDHMGPSVLAPKPVSSCLAESLPFRFLQFGLHADCTIPCSSLRSGRCGSLGGTTMASLAVGIPASDTLLRCCLIFPKSGSYPLLPMEPIHSPFLTLAYCTAGATMRTDNWDWSRARSCPLSPRLLFPANDFPPSPVVSISPLASHWMAMFTAGVRTSLASWD
mmetsp:Transcript_33673/g.54560  ORF Transcript_33673/g.54560 Transcript_33673/m.54560 type:complete len:317 (+) Transcript_33673:946-1896(+)